MSWISFCSDSLLRRDYITGEGASPKQKKKVVSALRPEIMNGPLFADIESDDSSDDEFENTQDEYDSVFRLHLINQELRTEVAYKFS